MRRVLTVLAILTVIAVALAPVSAAPAFANETVPVAPASLVTTPPEGLDSLLVPGSDPAWHWLGWGGSWGGGSWPWWAGMPVWSISALSGGVWPWACCWQLYTGWPWWGSSLWGGLGSWPWWGGWGGSWWGGLGSFCSPWFPGWSMSSC